MNKFVTTKSVVEKINSHQNLTDPEIEFIIDYVKKQPKLKIFVSIVTRMLSTYNTMSVEQRTTLVRQIKGYLPSEDYKAFREEDR